MAASRRVWFDVMMGIFTRCSYYDDATWSDQADLDIDHVVALAEAWDSGASGWTTAQRRAFANDLGDERCLVAVTDSVNQAKGDEDPATDASLRTRSVSFHRRVGRGGTALATDR